MGAARARTGRGDLSLPFCEGGRKHPGCSSGKGSWREIGWRLISTCWGLSYLWGSDTGLAFRSLRGGAGGHNLPPAGLWGSWLCGLQLDFQEILGWSLTVNMLPPPHSPLQRVLISYRDTRIKPQGIWQHGLWEPRGENWKMWSITLHLGHLILRGFDVLKSVEEVWTPSQGAVKGA